MQKSATEHSKGVMVRGYTREIERGQTFYEGETTVSGKNKDILLNPVGEVVEIEQQVAIGDVPGGAMQGLKKEAAGAKIVEVESVTKGEKVSYEAVIKNGKRREISVSSNGSPAAAE